MVTANYFFTDYTFENVMSIDPSVGAIINSHPAGSYTESAKQLCINNGIGLFTLAEFVGAIRKRDDEYLNYLLRSESNERLETMKREIRELNLPRGLNIYLFGSYLRRKIYRDVDILLVYQGDAGDYDLRSVESSLRKYFEGAREALDLTVASSKEFISMKFEHNNLTLVYP